VSTVTVNKPHPELKKVRTLADELALLTWEYAKELTQYRPDKIELTIDMTDGVNHFVLEVNGEWKASAYNIPDLEDLLLDELEGEVDVFDNDPERLGFDVNHLEVIENYTTPTCCVTLPDMW
jgi:hypothetical protein